MIVMIDICVIPATTVKGKSQCFCRVASSVNNMNPPEDVDYGNHLLLLLSATGTPADKHSRAGVLESDHRTEKCWDEEDGFRAASMVMAVVIPPLAVF